MINRKLNIGIIGAGLMGQLAHIKNYAAIEDCQIVALAEHRPILRKKVATMYGISKTYETHTELLKDPNVEAVVIITPRQFTGPVAYDCLMSGKHVLTEKPMAGTFEQGKRLVETAKKQKVKYVVGYMKRYDEGVLEAKNYLTSLIKDGDLGPILFVRAHCFMGDSFCNPSGQISTDEEMVEHIKGWPIYPQWIPKIYEMDFAGYLNTYSHDTNLLRFLFDKNPKPEYVNFTRMDGRLAVLNFGDFLCSLETGRSDYHYWDENIQIYFKKGHISIKLPAPLLENAVAKVEIYMSGKKPEERVFSGNWTWAFKAQAEAFVSDILQGNQSRNEGMDALDDLRLCEEMWKMQMQFHPHKG